ncbi:hypothetical protein LAZ67_9003355 [Cordylochernes scorpioides]|uniref:Reverse transcriptase domain-containing protein n=1 Tax=Cordylochernes scorpioides TaxID=51811 RepID=A0ABY6KW35_9ARAC|nr:hypothetical protein LAZ67_9003355 [Cordylochernes scorpioides]
MAQIQPPETFDFSTPNEWPKWRKRFERYLVVSGMKKKEEADKIDLFMYLMGDRADDIFRTFKFEKKEEATKIDSVLKAFDSHFCVRKNIIYERAKFNSRIQEDREPVDEFITSLYKLADSCEFEGLHEQLIRDRIVVGVRDKALSERMQLDSELTLEKAVKIVRQQEAVRQQQVDLQRPSASQKVNQVKFNSKKQSPKQQQQPSRKKEKSAKTRSRCPKCGGFTHREGQACRAEGQKCNLCSKTGHFANCCSDKQAKTAEVKAVSELDEEIGFLLEVSAVEDSSNLDDDEGECRRRWTAEIQVNGKKVKFKLDSQADVTCVPLCIFKKIMGQQRLVKSDINLRAAEFSELQTVGMFISALRNGNYEIKEKIYVIRRLSEPLLSRRACELLNLARRIEVVATRINPIKEFPEVFEGLGQIGNPYEIKLKPGAKPYAVLTPRRVPIPLMEKLKTRLEELEKAGIIAQVNVATEWCAPTVIAGKPNGDIRLCVDLSRLNDHVQREVHPMPVVEHMLGQLGEARLFSKLDANSGFHQIPLSPDCQHLTTFITPFGRYKYCRMPFGISLAPEYFQRVMSIILQGMDGVMCYLDDILIFASDSKTHDRILRLVLRKLKEAKVTLNKAKCVFGVPRINFLGHILDEDGIRPDPAKIEAVARMPAPTDVHGVRRFLGMVNHLGRKLRTTLPIAPEKLNPKLVDSQTLKRKEGRRRKDMKSRYDRRCGATDMEELSEGDTVWITDMRTWGIVKQKASTPRSYMVDTPVGTLRRNRFHLRKGYAVQYPADPSTPTFSGEELVENEKTPVVDYPSNDSEDGQIRTRSGRIVKPNIRGMTPPDTDTGPAGFHTTSRCRTYGSRITTEMLHYLFDCAALSEERRKLNDKTGQLCPSFPALINEISKNRVVNGIGKKREAESNGQKFQVDRPRPVRTPATVSKVKRLATTENPPSQRQLSRMCGTSLKTINNIIHKDLELDTRRKGKVHKLTPFHMKNRATNARKLYEEHLAGSRSEYTATLDEAWMYVTYCNGIRKICYIKRGNQVPDNWVHQCSETFPKGFMVVGVMTGRGVLPLIKVPSKVKVNSEFYIECVLKPVIEQLKDLYPGEMDKVFLHHDKASSHTSNKTQQFLQEMKDTLGLNFIRNSDIPVKSPDASPLDFYGFGMLKQRLFNRRPKTEAGLWKAAQEEWSNVSLSKVKEVFAAWKVRCREIAKKKGKHIEHMKKIHGWIFGHDLEDDALAILASAKTRIYKHFLGLEIRGVQEDPLIVWREVFASCEVPLDLQAWLFGFGLHPEAITTVTTIYKYYLGLELGNASHHSTCPLCGKELSQSIGGGVFPAVIDWGSHLRPQDQNDRFIALVIRLEGKTMVPGVELTKIFRSLNKDGGLFVNKSQY